MIIKNVRTVCVYIFNPHFAPIGITTASSCLFISVFHHQQLLHTDHCTYMRSRQISEYPMSVLHPIYINNMEFCVGEPVISSSASKRKLRLLFLVTFLIYVLDIRLRLFKSSWTECNKEFQICCSVRIHLMVIITWCPHDTPFVSITFSVHHGISFTFQNVENVICRTVVCD